MFPIILLTIEDERQRSFMEQLYLTHRSSMYRTAIEILRHPQDADDVIQTVFLSLCGKIPRLMQMSCYTLRSYIVISTRNAAIDVIRKRERRPELLWGEEEYLDGLIDAQNEEETALFSFLEQTALNQAMRQLTVKDRSLLEMKYILGKTDSEIAESLGIKPNSVRVLIRRVRGKLISILKEEGHETDKN